MPFYGTWTWLEHQKKKVKKAVKWRIIEGIDRSELVLLSFTRQESEVLLRWVHSREFEYNDEMYDVVESSIDEDSARYWCWWDYEETKLNRELRGIVSSLFGKSSNNKDKINNLISFYRALFCDDIPDYHFTPYCSISDYSNRYHFIYISPVILKHRPPPRFSPVII